MILGIIATLAILALATTASIHGRATARHREVRAAIEYGRTALESDVTALEARAIQKRLYDTYVRHLPYKDQPDMLELRAVLRKANITVEGKEAGRAHRQHGHEGPGGTLRPEDIER